MLLSKLVKSLFVVIAVITIIAIASPVFAKNDKGSKTVNLSDCLYVTKRNISAAQAKCPANYFVLSGMCYFDKMTGGAGSGSSLVLDSENTGIFAATGQTIPITEGRSLICINSQSEQLVDSTISCCPMPRQ